MYMWIFVFVIQLSSVVYKVLMAFELKIVVKNGANLIAADLNGKSDPYVKVSMSRRKATIQKTRTIKKTLNPVWDQTFTFDQKKSTFTMDDTLCFDVYDYDFIGRDDPIGKGEIPMLHIVTSGTYTNYPIELKEVKHGQIFIDFTFTDTSGTYAALATAKQAEIEAKLHADQLSQEASLQRAECKNMLPDFKDSPLVITDQTTLVLGLAWDHQGNETIDLDMAAVAYDAMGSIIDAAYYNQLTACNGGLVHSGDCRDGKTSDMAADETITVNFAGLSQAVGVIVLMASISSAGGSFQQVESATVNITTQNPPSQQYLPLGSHGNKSSLILGLLFRKYTETGPVWVFRQIEAATNGRNFDECKQMMQVYVDLTIGSEMVAERGSLRTDKKFVMHKDDAVTIPANMAQLHIGLGWTDIVDDSLDLDASVIMVDAKKSKVRTVYYGNKNGPGVKHQGDNTTGQGAGDDEVILINLNQVPANVHHLFFTVNVYAGGSFRDIRDSFIRLCLQDRQKTEVARYPLEPNISSRGVIFGCMTREGNAWFFKALGEQCGGQTADQIRCAHWS